MTRILFILLLTFSVQATQATGIPHLTKKGSATQLIVNGKPFIMLAGEIHNSSSSTLEYMQTVWPKLKHFHTNTVLMAVTWEQFEPVEGKFDYSLVDGLIRQARDMLEAATQAYNSAVPKELVDYLTKNRKSLHPAIIRQWEKSDFKTNGTWPEIFGGFWEADEIFSAWQYAKGDEIRAHDTSFYRARIPANVKNLFSDPSKPRILRVRIFTYE